MNEHQTKRRLPTMEVEGETSTSQVACSPSVASRLKGASLSSRFMDMSLTDRQEQVIPQSFKTAILNTTLKFIRDPTRLTLEYPEMSPAEAQHVYNIIHLPKTALKSENVGFGFKCMYSSLYEAVESLKEKYDFKVEYFDTSNVSTVRLSYKKMPKTNVSGGGKKADNTSQSNNSNTSTASNDKNSAQINNKKFAKVKDMLENVSDFFLKRSLERILKFLEDPPSASLEFKVVTSKETEFFESLTCIAKNEGYGLFSGESEVLLKRIGRSLKRDDWCLRHAAGKVSAKNNMRTFTFYKTPTFENETKPERETTFISKADKFAIAAGITPKTNSETKQKRHVEQSNKMATDSKKMKSEVTVKDSPNTIDGSKNMKSEATVKDSPNTIDGSKNMKSEATVKDSPNTIDGSKNMKSEATVKDSPNTIDGSKNMKSEATVKDSPNTIDGSKNMKSEATVKDSPNTIDGSKNMKSEATVKDSPNTIDGSKNMKSEATVKDSPNTIDGSKNMKSEATVKDSANTIDGSKKTSPQPPRPKPTASQSAASNSGQNTGGVKGLLLKGLATPVESVKAESMMRKMGWEGGALGARGEGIVEPISIESELLMSRRAGLGHVKPQNPKQPEKKPPQNQVQTQQQANQSKNRNRNRRQNHTQTQCQYQYENMYQNQHDFYQNDQYEYELQNWLHQVQYQLQDWYQQNFYQGDLQNWFLPTLYQPQPQPLMPLALPYVISVRQSPRNFKLEILHNLLYFVRAPTNCVTLTFEQPLLGPLWNLVLFLEPTICTLNKRQKVGLNGECIPELAARIAREMADRNLGIEYQFSDDCRHLYLYKVDIRVTVQNNRQDQDMSTGNVVTTRCIENFINSVQSSCSEAMARKLTFKLSVLKDIRDFLYKDQEQMEFTYAYALNKTMKNYIQAVVDEVNGMSVTQKESELEKDLFEDVRRAGANLCLDVKIFSRFKSILEKIEPRSVIVLDNAPYHTRKAERVPNMSWRKADIQNFLQEKEIPFEASEIKAELISKIDKSKYQKKVIDELAAAKGVTVLRLPPYHCELNPIELIWAQLKSYVGRNNKSFKLAEVEMLVKEGLTRIGKESWQKCIEHVIKREDEMMRLDGIIDNLSDNITPRFVIHVSDESESSSSSSGSESD